MKTYTPTNAQLEAAYEKAVREVTEDIEAGRVPADVAHFRDLHDYVDANCYGGLCDDDNAVWDADSVNALQDRVDAWLASKGEPMGTPCDWCEDTANTEQGAVYVREDGSAMHLGCRLSNDEWEARR